MHPCRCLRLAKEFGNLESFHVHAPVRACPIMKMTSKDNCHTHLHPLMQMQPYACMVTKIHALSLPTYRFTHTLTKSSCSKKLPAVFFSLESRMHVENQIQMKIV
jgi:hypothetical protein